MMKSMDSKVAQKGVPQAKEKEMPPAEASRKSHPPSKERRVSQAKVPTDRSSKKKCNHKELPRCEGVPEGTLRVENAPSSKGKEVECVSDAFELKREENYNKMLQHFRY